MRNKNSILRRIIFASIVNLFVIFLANSSVLASDGKISINSTPYAIYQPDGYLMRVVFKMQYNNENVFCLDNASNLPSSSLVLNNTGKAENSAAIKYIIEHAPTQITTEQKTYKGYTTNKEIAAEAVSNYQNQNDGSDIYRGSVNASNVDDSTYDSYVKTQLAIWYYLNNGVIKSAEGTNLTDSVKKTYSGFDALITNAKKAREESLSVSITGNQNMSLSEDGTYYVSDWLTVSSSKSTSINLSIPNSNLSGVGIYGESDQEVSSVQSGSKIRIHVPASSVTTDEVEITVGAAASIDKSTVQVYSSGKSDVQTIGRLVSAPEYKTAELKLKITKKPVVVISKLDAKGKNELSGATLQILDKDKKEISCTIVNSSNKEEQSQKCTWVTGTASVTIKNLPDGEYYLKEVSAPSKYVLNDDLIAFTVPTVGSVVELKMENELNVVKISKLDATGKNELSGAILEIQDKEGKIVNYCTDEKGNKNKACKWVSTDKPYEIEGMPNGKYYLVETIAPKGYALSKEKVSFEVDGSKATVQVKMINNLEPEVPDTFGLKSALYITIAMIFVGLGIGIFVYAKKQNSNKI